MHIFYHARLVSRVDAIETKTGSIVPYESENISAAIKTTDQMAGFELEARNLITIYHTNVISVRLVWRECGA